MHSIVIQEADFIPEEHPIVGDNPNNLPPWLIENLSQLSFGYWLPVQAHLIPMIMTRSSDFIVNAPTGSGKTLTYLIPIMAMLSSRIIPALRALIIAPTRDLAMQIYKIAILLTKGSDLRTIVVTGGSNSSSKFCDEQRSISYGGDEKMEPDSLFQPVDILISTPGRLVDHLNVTPGFNLSNLQFLVLDEVDRIVDGIQFQDWINPVLNSMSACQKRWKPDVKLEHILNRLNENENLQFEQQRAVKLLFSATITKNPLKLSQLRLEDLEIVTLVPGESLAATDTNTQFHSDGINGSFISTQGQSALVTTGNSSAESSSTSSLSSELQALESVPKFQTPLTLQEHFSVVLAEYKPIYLFSLLQRNSGTHVSKVLVFTKSVQSTERLYRLLKEMDPSLFIDYLSSSRGNEERKKVIKHLEEGQIKILISSDGLARGIDISQIDLVVNYDTAVHPRTYIHRVGRTARAGRSGIAHTLLVPQEARFFKEMMKKIHRCDGQKIRQVTLERPSQELISSLQKAVEALSK